MTVLTSIFSPCQSARSDLLTAHIVLRLLKWVLHGDMDLIQISYLSREVISWKPSENIREISDASESLPPCCHSYLKKEIVPPWGGGWRLRESSAVTAQGATAAGAKLDVPSHPEAELQVDYTRLKAVIVPPWDFCIFPLKSLVDEE